jgi:nitrilase
VLSACQVLPGADREWLIRGGSCVVGPLGQQLTGPVYGEECVLVADQDRADLVRAKFDFDVVGHYARPDVFTLHVNERPMKPVVFGGGGVALPHDGDELPKGGG